MNKKLVCLTLSILMLLTCVFASCTTTKDPADGGESTVDNSAKTIVMWVVTDDATTDEAKALRKLRHPSRARHLKGFLD